MKKQVEESRGRIEVMEQAKKKMKEDHERGITDIEGAMDEITRGLELDLNEAQERIEKLSGKLEAVQDDLANEKSLNDEKEHQIKKLEQQIAFLKEQGPSSRAHILNYNKIVDTMKDAEIKLLKIKLLREYKGIEEVK